MSSQTKTLTKKPSDERKLSEVARHVKIPKGIQKSGWKPVNVRCRKFGIKFDLWQESIGKIALGKRADGSYAASIGGVVLSIPRQTGKTYLVGWMIFALCTIFPGLTVIWTAHRLRTSDETFEKMRSMALKPKVMPYLDGKPRAANGQQMIKFKNGSRILFGARESGFGRGFDEVDILVLDEGQILTENAMSDMVPATNAAKNGLVLIMGTPPRPKDPGEVFSARRDDALNGDPDTAYIEFSADKNAKIIDWKQIAKANPSYPHRTNKTAILRMQKLLGSDENFNREAYGLWDEDGKTNAIADKLWKRRKVAVTKKPDVGRTCYGVKFSVDGSMVALAAAIRPVEGPVFVAGVKIAPLSEGTQWLVDWLVARHKNAAQIVVEGKTGVGFLVNALRDGGVKNKKVIIVPNAEQAAAAHSMFFMAIQNGELVHVGQSELDREAGIAVKRPIGRISGAFGWDAPEEDTVALLDAATLAFWAAKTTKRRTGLGQSRAVVKR